MKKQPVHPQGAKALSNYSPGMKAGNLLFISGQVASGADGKIVGVGDAAKQAEQVFKNLSAVLEAAGASLQDVVKITCFLAGREHYAAYAAARAKHFPKEPPASTTVIAAGLVGPEMLVEVEAVALLG